MDMMDMRSRPTAALGGVKTLGLIALSLVTLALLAAPATAQRGGRGDDDDRRGRGFGGGDFRERILSNLDSNGNGFIDPDEMQGRASGFVRRMAQEAGLDTDRPMEIRRLLGSGGRSRGGGRWGRGRDDDDDDRRRRGRDRDNDGDEAENGLYVRVPRFGNDNVVGFGLHPRLLAGRIIDLETEFDERILRYADRVMDRYDENGNSILDREEWEDVRWRDRDPSGSDLDNNGRLTMAELAHLFSQERDRGRGRDRRRGRDDDDDDDRRRRFARWGFGGFQRGERDRGDDDDDDDRGRRGGRRGGRGGFGFDPSRFLARLDRDGDGEIEPDEVDERQARFFGQRFNIDFSKSVSVEDLAGRIRGDGRQRREREEVQEEPEIAAAYRVNRDGLASRTSYREPASSNELPSSLSSKDRNKDGQVHLSEFMARPSHRDVQEFNRYDRDGDGIITPDEAARADRE